MARVQGIGELDWACLERNYLASDAWVVCNPVDVWKGKDVGREDDLDEYRISIYLHTALPLDFDSTSIFTEHLEIDADFGFVRDDEIRIESYSTGIERKVYRYCRFSELKYFPIWLMSCLCGLRELTTYSSTIDCSAGLRLWRDKFTYRISFDIENEIRNYDKFLHMLASKFQTWSKLDWSEPRVSANIEVELKRVEPYKNGLLEKRERVLESMVMRLRASNRDDAVAQANDLIQSKGKRQSDSGVWRIGNVRWLTK